MKDTQQDYKSDEELLRQILSELDKLYDTQPERFWNGMQRLAEIHLKSGRQA